MPTPQSALETIRQLIDQQGYVLLDGATGTNLFDRGLTSGDAPELWNIDKPEIIQGLYADWTAAGSNVILTNSFGGNRHRLKLHNAQDRVHELNQAAAALAREEADKAEQTVLVAGSMGPTGELMEPLGALTRDGAIEAFEEQAQALKDGGADLLWVETISASDEMAAALQACKNVGLPHVCTLSFDTNGHTMMGIAPGDMPKLVKDLGGADGFGANCGTGPSELVAVITAMRQAADPDTLLVAKANCGIPEFKEGKIQYSGDVPLMSAYAKLALAAGAQLVGGCCGTTPAHIRAMKEALEDYEPRPAPDYDEIEAILGAITRPQEGGKEAAGGRRRGRRRG